MKKRKKYVILVYGWNERLKCFYAVFKDTHKLLELPHFKEFCSKLEVCVERQRRAAKALNWEIVREIRRDIK